MRALALILLFVASRAFGAACAESPSGQMNCESFVARDQSSNNAVNFLATPPNDVALTVDPTCANAQTWSGLSSGLAITDTLESAVHSWGFCDIATNYPATIVPGAVSTPWVTGTNTGLGYLSLHVVPRLDISMDGSYPHGSITSSGDGLTVSNAGHAGIRILSASNTDTYSSLVLTRARGTPTSPLAVQNGNGAGYISFQGADGGAEREAAGIYAEFDNATGPGVMPGRISIYTTDAGGTATLRVKVDSAGNVTLPSLGGGSGSAIMCVDTTGKLIRGTAASCTGS